MTPLQSETYRTTRSGTAISVMLIVPDASGALDWYKRALGAHELWDLGGVAGLEIDGAPFFSTRSIPNNPSETSPVEAGRRARGSSCSSTIPTNSSRAALSAGATLGSPIEEHAVLRGVPIARRLPRPFGHNWSVGDRSPLRAEAT